MIGAVEKLKTLSICELKWAESWVTGKPELMADSNLTSQPQSINSEECISLRTANLVISFLIPSLFFIKYIWIRTYPSCQNLKPLFQHRTKIIVSVVN